MVCRIRSVDLSWAGRGLLQKAALWPMALWPYGLRFFLLFLLITQRHYSHPGSTGSMQAAKVRKFVYRLDFISASYAAAYHLHKHLLWDMLWSVIPKVIPYWFHAFDDAYRLFYHTNCKQRARRSVHNYYIWGPPSDCSATWSVVLTVII